MKGLTVNLNASALTNQGMVLVGQYGDKPTFTPDERWVITTDGGEHPNIPIGPVIKFVDIPTSTDELFAKDPQAARMPARYGAYMPLKFNDPVSLYEESRTATTLSPDGVIENGSGYEVGYPLVFSTLDANGVSTPNFLKLSHSGDFTEVLTSTGTTNMQSGVVIFTGLSPSVSIDIKFVAGLEVVATSNSDWIGFMDTPVQDDETAQKQVHAVQRRLPSGFPASYNSLGTLITTVLPYLGSLASKVVKGWYDRFTTSASRAVAMG
jgi:hypothetical protein